MAWLTENGSTAVASIVVGIPLVLLGLSLLFGQAKRGQWIFSPFTLYFLGVVLVIASIAGIYSGVRKSGIGLILGFGCFALAKKRKHDKNSY